MSDQRLSDGELEILVRYQLIAALQESEHDLAEAQRVARLGSWTWDVPSGLVTWSDELYRVCDVDLDSFTPSFESYLSLVHPDDRVYVEMTVRAALETHEAYAVNHRLASDADRWIRGLGEIDVDANGVVVRLHGTAQDITDHVAALATAGRCTEAAPAPAPDPLTGLATHPSFRDLVRRDLPGTVLSGDRAVLFVVDIDDFHKINERYGHSAGDEVLVALAARLGESLGAGSADPAHPSEAPDVAWVARLGGDRFLALCGGLADEDAVLCVADRVRVRAAEPLTLSSGAELRLTVGIGAAIAGGSGDVIEGAIRDAEEALRQAKRAGSGQCRVMAESIVAERRARRDAESALRQALERDEFVLHYQPKVSLESDRVTGYEALVRWHDPARGLVPPLEFIDLAEETGLIVPIGTWVIEQACAQVAEWHRRFPRHPPLVVAVNVSGSQFGPELVDHVEAVLAATGTSPGQLCLEVTESTLITDVDDAIETLQRLAALRVKISIDDFGTGFSSLAYLKRLPLHELKIDKTFVDGLGVDSDDAAIVGATVAMAHALGLSVIAEGVETADQMERLMVIGCQEIQGYFVARPMPAEAATAFLEVDERSGWREAIVSAQQVPLHSYKPPRVLLVDDTADVRQLARMALAAAGFEVHEAADGPEALSLARELEPDCVVLDVSMHGMSGIDVCRALRRDARTAYCTIIMLTANSSANRKVEAFSGGADDYIVKPFSPRDLVGRVRAALRIHQESVSTAQASGTTA